MDSAEPEESSIDVHALLNPVTKRARQQLSCTFCRSGKLRCDRHLPCNQCERRNKPSACHYLDPPVKKRPNENIKRRVRNLEQLVVRLLADSPSAAASSTEASSISSSSSGPAGVAPKNGVFVASARGSEYVQSTHWAAILDDLTRVRANIEADELDEADGLDDADNPDPTQRYDDACDGKPVPTPLSPGPPLSSVLFTQSGFRTRADLIAALPPQDIADQLVQAWIVQADPMTIVIHRPTFARQYSAFWATAGKSASPMWIAMLATVVWMGTAIVGRIAESANWADPAASAAARALRQDGWLDSARARSVAAHAVGYADICRPQLHTVETLILFTVAEIVSIGVFGMEIVLLSSMVSRTAARMGYHQMSPPTMSVFDAEMRRRVWLAVEQLDTMSSFAVGLPTVLQAVPVDCRRPANLDDADFDEHSTRLPPSRPLSESTSVSYLLAKSHFTVVFSNAAVRSNKPDESYSQILDLDRALEQAHAAVPDQLRIQYVYEDPVGVGVNTLPHHVICAFNLTLLYYKAKCVLHRPFVLADRADRRFAHSRREAVKNALLLLLHHHMIDDACQPGRQLGQTGWYIRSLNTHDFLLAAMIVCLELCRYAAVDPALPVQPDQSLGLKLQQITAILRRSHDIFVRLGTDGPGMKKAAAVMRSMIGRTEPLISRLSGPDASAGLSRSTAQMVNSLAQNSTLEADPFGALPTLSPVSLSPADQIPVYVTLPLSTNEPFDAGMPTILDPRSLASQQDSIDWTAWDGVVTASTAVDEQEDRR